MAPVLKFGRSKTRVVKINRRVLWFDPAPLAIFAGIALLLAAVGIYGVVSYSLTQRLL